MRKLENTESIRLSMASENKRWKVRKKSKSENNQEKNKFPDIISWFSMGSV
jgi:hypothetical protein